MFQIIFAKSCSDKKTNEDIYSYSKKFAMVLDGASGLNHANIKQTGSDAYWFVSSLKKEIEKRINSNLPLKEIVRESLNQIIPQYPKVDAGFMPSGCLSLIRENKDRIEYIGFGDTVALIKTKNKLECLYDHKIQTLDQKAIQAKMKKQEYLPILIQNRNFRNQPNGYCALDLTQESLNYCIYKTWKKEDVQSFILMSDGMYQLKEFLHINNQDLFQFISSQKEESLRILYDLQEKDWPNPKILRLKKRDDTTCLYMKTKDGI